MSKDFIRGKINSESLDKAVRQNKQLDYLLTSEISDNYNYKYFEEYIKRDYFTDDIFLNWAKSLFKKDNFLSFVKYFQNPNPSSSLIKDKVLDPLSRVFFSSDSHFNYIIKGELQKRPKEIDDDFDQELFNAILFRHNDIIVHDLKDTNKPYREIVSIDKVVSIDADKEKIYKVAYTAKTTRDGKDVYGYAYIDDKEYSFYAKDFNLVDTNPHDLGFCPVGFVVNKGFGKDIISKESFFSYLKGDLMHYCFLITLQRMTDVNGATPIIVRPKVNIEQENSNDFDNRNGEPMSLNQIGGQVSKEVKSSAGSKANFLTAGTVIEAPINEKEDGSIDVDFIRNFFTFHYTPTEALDLLEKRIKKVESDILVSSIGESRQSMTSEGSKSDSEIKSVTVVSKEDKLRTISNTMSHSKNFSDMTMLSLAYGRNNIEVDVFYGSDFFLETDKEMYKKIETAPNNIERSNILLKITQKRGMFNKMKYKREFILYKLLPYSTDLDFDKALQRENIVSDEVFVLQTQFSYWIAKFESFYGNIVIFWDDLGDAKESEKIIYIKKLILDLITKNRNYGKKTDS